MTITLEWDNLQKTCILWSYSDGWTWNDFSEAINEGCEMANRVEHGVDVIFDTGDTRFPTTGIVHDMWVNAMKSAPPNLGTIVVSTTLPFAREIATMFSKILSVKGYRMLVTATVEEAHTALTRNSVNTPEEINNMPDAP